MKKTFQLAHPKIKIDRMVDSVKHDVKKYIKRERNKVLPEGADFWDFDCKFGDTEQQAEIVHMSAINKSIDQARAKDLSSFYIEILAKPAIRQYKAEEDNDEADLD